MIELLVPQASSYAADVDNLITLITVLVGFWFLLAEGIFFYFIFKFKAKEGQKAQYITGEKKEEKKWITRPHNAVLVCDVILIAMGVLVFTGELTRLNLEAQQALNDLGINFFNEV